MYARAGDVWQMSKIGDFFDLVQFILYGNLRREKLIFWRTMKLYTESDPAGRYLLGP